MRDAIITFVAGLVVGLLVMIVVSALLWLLLTIWGSF